MENLYEVGLAFIHWLQETYPQLSGFFTTISAAGREEFYLILLTLIYWCINKQLGKLLGYVLFIAVAINTILKHAIRNPRPFWLDPTVGLQQTGGYGIPSGHTQYATAIYLLIASFLGGFWVWLIAGFLILIMALSRIYLGAHFIQDVVGGFAVGVLILAGALLWQQHLHSKYQKRILGQRLLIAVSVIIILGAIYVIVQVLLGEPDMSVPWSAYIPEAELASKTEFASAVGTLLGYSIGILLEGSRIRFRVDGSFLKRAGRYIVGIVITFIIWQGLGLLFPREPLVLAIPLRIFRYFLVLLWATYFAPWLFVRVGLADADPLPQMKLSL